MSGGEKEKVVVNVNASVALAVQPADDEEAAEAVVSGDNLADEAEPIEEIPVVSGDIDLDDLLSLADAIGDAVENSRESKPEWQQYSPRVKFLRNEILYAEVSFANLLSEGREEAVRHEAFESFLSGLEKIQAAMPQLEEDAMLWGEPLLSDEPMPAVLRSLSVLDRLKDHGSDRLAERERGSLPQAYGFNISESGLLVKPYGGRKPVRIKLETVAHGPAIQADPDERRRRKQEKRRRYLDELFSKGYAVVCEALNNGWISGEEFDRLDDHFWDSTDGTVSEGDSRDRYIERLMAKVDELNGKLESAKGEAANQIKLRIKRVEAVIDKQSRPKLAQLRLVTRVQVDQACASTKVKPTKKAKDDGDKKGGKKKGGRK